MSNAKVVLLRPREQATAERTLRHLGPIMLAAQDIIWILRLAESKLQPYLKTGKD
jgi:hypothetical protein